jgi:hypothetical protein
VEQDQFNMPFIRQIRAIRGHSCEPPDASLRTWRSWRLGGSNLPDASGWNDRIALYFTTIFQAFTPWRPRQLRGLQDTQQDRLVPLLIVRHG